VEDAIMRLYMKCFKGNDVQFEVIRSRSPLFSIYANVSGNVCAVLVEQILFFIAVSL
jgi:hypothetical protein